MGLSICLRHYIWKQENKSHLRSTFWATTLLKVSGTQTISRAAPSPVWRRLPKTSPNKTQF